MSMSPRNNKGMILVFTLWVLAILTIMVASVAAGIRQKIILVQHLDERSRLNYLTQAALKKTIAYIGQQMDISAFQYTPALKMNLHHNTNELSKINLGPDEADVEVVDEERKINLNKVDKVILKNLVGRVLGVKEEEAQRMADALLDWRQYGQAQAKGFFSDDYYANLQYPYPKKDADYETLDEVLLVKGIGKGTYERLMNFVTIYGEGAVNVNTACAEVLGALGLDDPLVAKILAVRRGKDGIEATGDDHVFSKSFDVASEVNAAVKLDLREIHAIDDLNKQGLLTTNSSYFTVDIGGRLAHARSSKKVRAVVGAQEHKIIYWKEK